MNIDQSVSFVEEKGSGLEKARIRWILQGIRPETETTRSFTELQNEDGGFPCDLARGNLSSIDQTLVALWWLDELGMLESPTAGRVYAYFLAMQKEDGGWDEDPALAQYGLPPWIAPGALRTRLYLSAYVAYWLGVKEYGTHRAFQEALAFILKHQDETGRFYGYLHTTWLATSVLAMAGEPYAKAAAKGLQALLDVPPADWADSQIAWALDCLSRAGVPQAHPFVDRCLSELVRRQAAGGSWSSEDGDAYAVGATIQAVKVLHRFCPPSAQDS